MPHARRCAAVVLVVAVTIQAAAAAEKSQEEINRELMQRIEQLEKREGERERPAAALGAVVAPLARRVEVSGEVRVRGEYRSVRSYATDAGMRQSEDFALLRARLGVDADVNDWLRAFVQFQDSRTFGEEASTTADTEGADLHQGCFDVRLKELPGTDLVLRAGRQEIALGSGRLVERCAWSNAGRSFDGARLIWKQSDWEVNLFGANVHEVPASTDEDHVFSGLHAAYGGLKDHAFEAYAYHRRFAEESFVGETGSLGELRDTTVGARAAGKAGPWDYEAEGAWQTGERADDDVDAWMAVARAGYSVPGCPCGLRLGLEYDYASGDPDPADGEWQTFDPLYGLNHWPLGVSDYVVRSNVHDFVAEASASPFGAKDWVVSSQFHWYRLAEAEDAWRGSNLAVVRRDATGESSADLGREINLQVAHKTKNIEFSLGAARFLAGEFVEDTTGRDQDATWAFLQCAVKF